MNVMSKKQIKNVFRKISERVNQRADSLQHLNDKSRKCYNYMGLEGWLKIEAIHAIQNSIKKVRGKGADLQIEINGKDYDIELKGMTNFSVSYIRKGLGQADVCLFLADGDQDRLKKLSSFSNVELVDSQFFSDGINKWLLGIIKRK